MAKPRRQVGRVCWSHHQNTPQFTATKCDWSLDLSKKKKNRNPASRGEPGKPMSAPAHQPPPPLPQPPPPPPPTPDWFDASNSPSWGLATDTITLSQRCQHLHCSPRSFRNALCMGPFCIGFQPSSEAKWCKIEEDFWEFLYRRKLSVPGLHVNFEASNNQLMVKRLRSFNESPDLWW